MRRRGKGLQDERRVMEKQNEADCVMLNNAKVSVLPDFRKCLE